MITDDVIAVKTGYGDCFNKNYRVLNFKTIPCQADKAKELVKLIDDYNNFNGEKVAEIVEKIGGVKVEGSLEAEFEFGREYSPVLYIHLWDFTPSMIEWVKSLLESVEADEIHVVPISTRAKRNGFTKIRAWWD
jgi:hypothetical protein